MSEGEEAAYLFLVTFIFTGFFIAYLTVYKPAETDAKIYNQKFGTSYSSWDFFWSGDTIKKLMEEKVSERPKNYKLEIDQK